MDPPAGRGVDDRAAATLLENRDRRATNPERRIKIDRHGPGEVVVRRFGNGAPCDDASIVDNNIQSAKRIIRRPDRPSA